MKSLIAYGTRYGSTSNIASFMADVLREEVFDVEVVELTNKEKPSYNLTAYDLIIIGSAVRMGKWTGQALDFIKKNERILATKRAAFFVSCASVLDPTKRSEAKIEYLDKVLGKYPSIRPVALGLFGGFFDFIGDHGFFYRLTLGAFRKQLEKEGVDVSMPYDFRDWDEIRDWTRSVGAYIQAHPSPV
ncbi:MAG: flavodoxin domain-containing protein [Nitrososphaerota archaeon]|nr:flavodoxin domain-containing protein [Nitrososphaerota archaeon]